MIEIESSSDSEDDCYNNVASKLQILKNKYIKEDNLNSSKLLQESRELDKLVRNVITIEEPAPENDDLDSSTILDDILRQHSSSVRSRRVTRASARKSAENNVEETTVVNTASTTAVTNPEASSNTTVSPRGRGGRRGRGRGRSRGRRSTGNAVSPRGNRGRRNRNNHYNYYDLGGPIYSVGNTDDYPDMSDDMQLFSTSKPKENDVVIIDANESFDENEEMSVKVYWQSAEFVKFVVRKYQKLSQIFDYFARRENVKYDNLLFTYNDKILKPDDTPDSIGYRIAKFIDGGITQQNVSNLTSNRSTGIKNGIKLKFQCQNVKKPFEISIGLDEKFSLAMMMYSEHIEKPLDKLKFEFDGDSISGKSTPRDLDLEGGECVDVKILS